MQNHKNKVLYDDYKALNGAFNRKADAGMVDLEMVERAEAR